MKGNTLQLCNSQLQYPRVITYFYPTENKTYIGDVDVNLESHDVTAPLPSQF